MLNHDRPALVDRDRSLACATHTGGVERECIHAVRLSSPSADLLARSYRYGLKMLEDVDRIVVLLGAGASADAGLPLTSGLAQIIVEKANAADGRNDGLYPSPSDFVSALNAVYASMVGHQGQRGKNPLTAVNIETLISAVRLLQDRDRHEVAPFVSAWSAAVSDFPSNDIPSEPGSKIAEVISKGLMGGHISGSEISDPIATIARAAIRPNLARPFFDAEQFVLSSLVEILGAVGDVGYLDPLIELARTQAGGLDVITLNYDLTVETAALNGGIPVARGIETWRPGSTIDLPAKPRTLNLLKLHGSLDWRRERPDGGVPKALAPPRLRISDLHAEADSAHAERLPWIVVGNREKLATDGPTLPLHFAARKALAKGTHLAVVGYSFGDDHINAMIRDWLAAEPARTISVLDKYWERHRYWSRPTDFKSILVNEYGRDRADFGKSRQPRLVAVEGTARDELAHVLKARPALTPRAFVSATASRTADTLKIAVTWHGNDLTGVTLSAAEPAERGLSGTQVPLFSTPELIDDSLFGHVEISELSRDQTVEVFARSTAPLPLRISLNGVSITGSSSGMIVLNG